MVTSPSKFANLEFLCVSRLRRINGANQWGQRSMVHLSHNDDVDQWGSE